MMPLPFERPVWEIEMRIKDLEKSTDSNDVDFTSEIVQLKKRLAKVEKEIYSNLTPWQQIQLARHPDRPFTLDYINNLCADFVELHGDRNFRDDPAMVGGLATFEGRSVVVVGQQKGRDTKENMWRSFGMPHPEGFRKSMRLLKLAERFHLPVIAFVDCKGASPDTGSEERGQAWAIADNLEVMAALKTPIVAIITGEGGSGGALAIAMGDRVLVMENAFYAVCMPEACASILFKDPTLAPDIVGNMKIMPRDLKQLGIVDEIVPEPLGGAQRNVPEAMANVREAIRRALDEVCAEDIDDLVEKRYQRFRSLGSVFEAAPVSA